MLDEAVQINHTRTFYLLHDKVDAPATSKVLPLPTSRPAGLVVSANGAGFIGLPEISLDGTEWFPVVGRRTDYASPVATILESTSAYLFDVSGAAFFRVRLATGTGVTVKALLVGALALTYSDVENTPKAYTSRQTTSGVNTYIGIALPGTPPSAPLWQIKRVLDSAGLIRTEYANGSAAFTNVWDNRTTYSYS